MPYCFKVILAKETLDQDIDPLASAHYTNLKPLVNSCIHQLDQTKWDVAVHGSDLYLVKPTLGPPKKFQHLTRAEEVITRLRIGHTKAKKSHDPNPRPSYFSQSRGSHDLGRDQCRIGLPPEDTQLSTMTMIPRDTTSLKE